MGEVVVVVGGRDSLPGLEGVEVPAGGRGILRRGRLSLPAGRAVSGLSGPSLLLVPVPPRAACAAWFCVLPRPRRTPDLGLFGRSRGFPFLL